DSQFSLLSTIVTHRLIICDHFWKLHKGGKLRKLNGVVGRHPYYRIEEPIVDGREARSSENLINRKDGVEPVPKVKCTNKERADGEILRENLLIRIPFNPSSLTCN